MRTFDPLRATQLSNPRTPVCEGSCTCHPLVDRLGGLDGNLLGDIYVMAQRQWNSCILEFPWRCSL